MKKVMVFGTFDIIHPGHLFFLKKARSMGDKLFVVVGRDETVKNIKEKPPVNDEETRMENLKGIEGVDKVILGHESSWYKRIEEVKPDIICLGYDQNSFSNNLDAILSNLGLDIEIIRLEPFKEDKYKSSLMRDSE